LNLLDSHGNSRHLASADILANPPRPSPTPMGLTGSVWGGVYHEDNLERL